MSYICNTCKSTDVTVKALDNVPAEISYKCNDCGEHAYFAYGHYENDHFPFAKCDAWHNFTLEQAKDLIAEMKKQQGIAWTGLGRIAEQMTEMVDKLTSNKTKFPPATCGCDSYAVTWSRGKNGNHMCSAVLPNSIMVFGSGPTPEEALVILKAEIMKW